MVAAVLEFRNLQRNRLCRFADLFVGNVVYFSMSLLVLDNLFFYFAGYSGIMTQPVIDRELHFFDDRSADFNIAELVFCLAREHRSEERRVGKECRSRWS